MASSTVDQNLLYTAVRALAARCDGALARDGAGFNGLDSSFGKSLARLPFEQWSPKQKRAAWSLLFKYKGQLRDYGINYYDIPEPPRFVAPAAVRTIDTARGMFVVKYPYDPAMNQALAREVPSRRWSPQDRAMLVPVDGRTADQIADFAKVHGFDLTEGAVDAIDEQREKLAAFVEAQRLIREQAQTQFVRAAEVPKPSGDTEKSGQFVPIKLEGFGGTPHPFQLSTAEFNLRHNRALNALEQGLGKTMVALLTAHSAYAFPLVCVVPAVVKLNWRNEVNHWLPGRSVLVVEGVKPVDMTGYYVVVINYDILYAHAEAIKALKPAMVVLDESHRIKTRGARRTKACQDVCKGVERVVCLTGTPVMNRPIELAEQLKALDRLSDLGGWWRYATYYCGARKGRFGMEYDAVDNARLLQLNNRLRQDIMVRLTKKDVLPELPAITHTVVPATLTNRKTYDHALANLFSYLREFEGDEAAFRAMRAQHLVQIEKLKSLSAAGKLAAVRDWIDEFLEDTDEKLIVFASHRDIQRQLAEAFPTAARITGDQNSQERQDNVERFQQDDDCRLIICSLAAGSEGITLTAASNVLFIEFPWGPTAIDQGVARCYGRLNDMHGANAYHIVGAHTIDEQIIALIDEKRKTVNAVTDGIKTDDDSGDILSTLLGRLREEAGVAA